MIRSESPARAGAYQAVVFDLDGTLLDTLGDLAGAMNETLESRGFPVHPVDAYRYFIGDGVRQLVRRVLPESCDATTNDDVLNSYISTYRQRWDKESRPYDGIPAMLDELTARGVPLGICSNKPDDLTRACTDGLLASWSFGEVIGQSSTWSAKPDPAGALHVADQLNVPPADCLFVGDSGVDMRTAINAGMGAGGVLWGFRKAGELEESGADFLFARPEEILTQVVS